MPRRWPVRAPARASAAARTLRGRAASGGASKAWRGRRRGKHGVQAGDELFLGEGVGLRGVPVGVPLVERRLHLIAGDGGILVYVDRGEHAGRDAASPAPSPL